MHTILCLQTQPASGPVYSHMYVLPHINNKMCIFTLTITCPQTSLFEGNKLLGFLCSGFSHSSSQEIGSYSTFQPSAYNTSTTTISRCVTSAKKLQFGVRFCELGVRVLERPGEVDTKDPKHRYQFEARPSH